MRELGEDEAKYTRELKTLVDGVIPVLLTCVLSKSNSAIAAGLFNPNGPSEDNTITKPIVDMGVALERLKISHKRIPLTDADAFVSWAQSVHCAYQDYLMAWRAGFQDVVVNLEPASTSTVDEKLGLDDIARDENGDAVGANGQRADVAYFLKRPLVRVKNLARVTKGLSKLLGTEKSQRVEEQFHELNETVRRRYKEESARLEDENANNTDPTRARDPRTLDLIEGVEIDRTRQVCARDIFHLDLQHSTGQRVGCRVEIILRDKPQDPGDVLICEMDDLRRFLLFPPVSKELLSARRNEIDGQLVVMIRGSHETEEWNELLLLEGEDPEASAEWVDLLGSNPLPPPIVTIIDNSKELDDLVTGVSPPRKKGIHSMSGGLSEDTQVPIGERLRREAEERAHSPRQDRRRVSQHRSPPSFGKVPESIREESVVSEGVVDLNDAMNQAGALASPKRPRAARYHDRSTRPTTPKSDKGEHSLSAQTTPTRSSGQTKAVSKLETRNLDRFGPRDFPYIPKVHSSSSPSSPESSEASTPLKASMRPESAPLPSRSPLTTPTREDGAPPPPAHRTPKTPSVLKNVPTIETPIPRALNRRGSSPLKHEYQPSADGSKTSSAAGSKSDTDSDSDSTGTYSDSESEDEELEAADIRGPVPVYGKRVSPSGSIYSLPNTTLAPSNSASQGPYRSAPVQCLPGDMEKHVVMSLSYWNEKGQWINIYTGPCSVVIGPGWLRAYKLDGSDNNFTASGNFGVNEDGEAGIPRPLIGQELTPNVSLQRHTIDIHVRSPPMAESSLKCKGSTIRYHMLTPVACVHFYQALYESCKNNMTYNKLEEERRVNAYGTYGEATPTSRRISWFGRRNSYRASARAPSDMVSEQTGRSSQSKLSAVRSLLSGGSIFNIAKSSIDVSQGGHGSGSTSLGSSEYSGTGITPPRTPTSMWSGTSTSQMKDLGSENIRIRLYHLATATKWEDKRYAFLTVTPPPPGRRPNSTLHHGLEKHIIVTRREHNHKDGPGEILLDEVLGSHCFQMVGVKGVMATIWDDIRDEQGMVGQIGAKGGVSGRQRKFLFQMAWVRHANWVYGLCAAGR
ncbi:hypothetical protein BJ875DRAFT_365134 [Amylocarpus encephaloides]|uniref:Uncharacterized protein n=1 Tax=Amylocarpus encephaloides TaxID=45428 RepID=A0A9P7YTM7_9HELO|nr:hypothetical protein BJ875DRAFT_365134 [Amylocarpus encephaloides]